MKHFVYRFFIFTVCLSAIFTLSVAAQTVTGSLVGHVEDAAGATVPGARVTVTEINRGTSREITTNEEGNYSIGSLDPGVYRIEITQANFKKLIQENVEVAINTTVRVDGKLEAGGVSETVQIEAEQVQLKTDRADVSTQITSEQLEELPLSPDRNYQSVLDITPGVSEAATVGSSFGNPNGSLTNRINGQNERYNNFQLDGTINNQTNVISQTAIVPSPESIQVVDVSTNAYDAEQGRASGGVINVQIKSGTNRLRGSAFAFNTNSALKAKNTLSTLDKPNTNLNQFGFTLGGPIRRDKTFFFADYQGGRDRRGQSVVLSVPTEAFRNGNFSASSSRIYDPLTGTATGAGRTQFAGNIIPQNRISPAARAILAALPLPNLPGTTENYETSGTFLQNRDAFNVKINHNFTDTTTGFVRYSFFNANTSDVPSFGILGGPSTSGGLTAAEGPGRNHSVSANLTHVFSNSLITEFRFGYVRVNISAISPTEENLSTRLGIPGINQGDFFTSGGIPRIAISGFDFLGIAATVPFDIRENSFNIVNNWTKTLGNHTIRFGGDIRRLRLDKFQASGSNPRGDYTFTSGVTTLSGQTGTSTNAFASFLLGLPQSVARTTVNQLGGYQLQQYFFFAQDRWQVSPKLTVNYGLRYEIYPYAIGLEAGDQSRYLPETNQSLISGYGSTGERLGVRTEYNNFAPRLGVAYRLDEKTVIRTGYGLSYVPIGINTLATQNFPGQVNVQFQGSNSLQPARDPGGNLITLSTGIPVAPTADVSSGVLTPPGNVILSATNPDAKRGYVQSYNFTVERDIFGFVTSVGYVGSRGTRLPGTININAVGALPNRAVTTADRPLARQFGRTADTFYTDFMLSNSYHSLQARVDRRFTRLGRLTAAYTFSKSFDYTDAFTVRNPLSIDAERGPSDFDRRHNLVVSHVLRLPFGRGGKIFDSNGLRLSGLIGGFTLSGVFTARSGTPVDITGIQIASRRPSGITARPNIIGPARILGGLGPGQPFFDTSVFQDPAQGELGNVGRNSLRGPSYFNYNATLARTFGLTERFKLQLQLAAFNVTNTPHFRNPSGDFTNQNTFGQSRSTFGERQIRLGARLTF